MAIEGSGKSKGGRTLAKDFYRLIRNISGLSGGQARLVGWDETDLKKGISVSVVPDNGPYKDGEFIFSIQCGSRYPDRAPEVYCKTLVYHPNIDNVDGCGDICLNMLDDDYWSGSLTLEDVVQGILFLMHNPNLEDPLNVLFNPGMDKEEFADNVRCSLDGGMVEGYHFERNRVVRGEGRAIPTDAVGERVVVKDVIGEGAAVITDGCKTKEVVSSIDEGRGKASDHVTTDEGDVKNCEVVIIVGDGSREGVKVVSTDEGQNQESRASVG